MCTGNLTDKFKRVTVARIIGRGYAVSEVSEPLGVGKHSLYAGNRNFVKAALGEMEKDAEIRRLKRELVRVSEERGIPKRRVLSTISPWTVASAYFARDAK
ncbi:hypothetical protein Q4511_14795 [Paracoccus sp. 1_MG-2023]|uniref:hypothetical protein n=1 Tax=Paracoccus sp. 1_MG-2023 TaxID=3062651 RepID=UPI00208FFF10|nr:MULTISPECIES: hypothetical protein [unclassified Paracoccus (in: a-proteobacteria)]MDO6670193.1 hypothetical protein [Paracoccus sp. 1_MG-2023]